LKTSHVVTEFWRCPTFSTTKLLWYPTTQCAWCQQFYYVAASCAHCTEGIARGNVRDGTNQIAYLLRCVQNQLGMHNLFRLSRLHAVGPDEQTLVSKTKPCTKLSTTSRAYKPTNTSIWRYE